MVSESPESPRFQRFSGFHTTMVVVAIERERRSSDSFSWAELLVAWRTIRRPVFG
jgi:hypothetical protein